MLLFEIVPIIPVHYAFSIFCGISKYKMSEGNKPMETKKKRRKLVKTNELIIGIVFIAVCAVLVVTIVNKIRLHRDVTAAQAVSDKVITDINKRDGAGIRSLGSPGFQKIYTATELTKDFKSVEIATLKMPDLDQQIVVDGSNGRTVYFIYKYGALKVPFYVRTTIHKQSGHWYLTGVNGNADEGALNGDE